MMIQQMLPPQKPLLLHINITAKNFSAAVCRSFQDIPAKEFGAKNTGEEFLSGMVCIWIIPTGRRGIYLRQRVRAVRQ